MARQQVTKQECYRLVHLLGVSLSVDCSLPASDRIIVLLLGLFFPFDLGNNDLIVDGADEFADNSGGLDRELESALDRLVCAQIRIG